MSIQQIHFAVNLATNEVEIFGTKYLCATNYRGSRLAYGKINLSLEKRGKFKTVSWANECPGSGQDSQLQFRLGDQWRVMSQYETLTALQDVFRIQSAVDRVKEKLKLSANSTTAV